MIQQNIMALVRTIKLHDTIDREENVPGPRVRIVYHYLNIIRPTSHLSKPLKKFPTRPSITFQLLRYRWDP